MCFPISDFRNGRQKLEEQKMVKFLISYFRGMKSGKWKVEGKLLLHWNVEFSISEVRKEEIRSGTFDSSEC